MYHRFLSCRRMAESRQNTEGSLILSLSLPVGIRGGLGAFIVLRLTSPGFSSNNIIRALIPDVIEATTSGIEINDWNRDKLTVFVDIIKYTADYAGVAHTVDAGSNWIPHPRLTANVPRHDCTFQKSNASKSRNAYTFEIHSRHTFFSRDLQKMDALRKFAVSHADTKHLGL